MDNTQPVTKVENLEYQLKRKNGEPPARFHALEYLLLWEPALGFCLVVQAAKPNILKSSYRVACAFWEQQNVYRQETLLSLYRNQKLSTNYCKEKKKKKEKAKFKNKRKTAIYLLLVYIPGQRNNLTILHMYSLVNFIGSYSLYAFYGTIPHLSSTLSILKTGIKNYLDSWI